MISGGPENDIITSKADCEAAILEQFGIAANVQKFFYSGDYYPPKGCFKSNDPMNPAQQTGWFFNSGTSFGNPAPLDSGCTSEPGRSACLVRFNSGWTADRAARAIDYSARAPTPSPARQCIEGGQELHAISSEQQFTDVQTPRWVKTTT